MEAGKYRVYLANQDWLQNGRKKTEGVIVNMARSKGNEYICDHYMNFDFLGN